MNGMQIFLSDEDLEVIAKARETIILTSKVDDLVFKKIDAHSNTEELKGIFENKNIESIRINDFTPLWGNFFPKGETIVLASGAGIGKSWFSIEVAKSPKVKKVLFLLLEDYSKNQLPRYIKSLDSEKYEIVSYSKWKQLYNQVKQSLERKVNIQIIQENICIEYAQLVHRREMIRQKYGIREGVFLDNFLVFETLMQKVSGLGFDLVCIDSLNAFTGHLSKLTRENLERLIAIPSELGMTFLLIHHLNKKGELSGSSELSNVVDSVYILDVKDGISSDGDKTRLEFREEKARHKGKCQKCEIERKFTGKFTADHSIIEGTLQDRSRNEISSETLTLEKRIINLLAESEDGELEFSDLSRMLKEHDYDNEVSIKNCLKQMEKKGLVSKGIKDSWDIVVLVSGQNASSD